MGSEAKDTIRVRNAGPVEELDIPVQAEGGISVIRGLNDVGKSETLRAIKRLLGSSDKITRRYGTPRGLVEGLGCSIRLMASVRQQGQAEAVSIEGRLDLDSLVDPGLKDPVAADRARIKALLAIRGVEADPSHFFAVVGGEERFWEIASGETRAAKDLVEMALGLKRDVEKVARATEQAAQAEAARADALRQACSIDEDAELPDLRQLQQSLEEAITAEAHVKQRRTAAVAAVDRAEVAGRTLERAQAEYTGPTLADAVEQCALAREGKEERDAEVRRLEAALQTAREQRQEAASAVTLAESRVQAAREHQATVEQCREALEQLAAVDDPPQEELDRAASAVSQARQAIEEAAVLARQREQLQQARSHAEAATEREAEAATLRDAAKACEEVLADAVQSKHFRLGHDDRGNPRFIVSDGADDGRRVYYHDLGPGQRWTRAIQEGAERLREIGAESLALLPIRQESWEGLDWKNRQLILERVRELGVRVLTAEADKDPEQTGTIRVEEFCP